MNKWDQRYAAEEFIFGTEPHDFVRRVRPYLPAAGRALDLATGEGRNGVFLAQCGLSAEGVDSSPVAVAKAEKMAALKGVDFAVRVSDITAMRMPPECWSTGRVKSILVAPPAPTAALGERRMSSGMVTRAKNSRHKSFSRAMLPQVAP